MKDRLIKYIENNKRRIEGICKKLIGRLMTKCNIWAGSRELNIKCIEMRKIEF